MWLHETIYFISSGNSFQVSGLLWCGREGRASVVSFLLLLWPFVHFLCEKGAVQKALLKERGRNGRGWWWWWYIENEGRQGHMGLRTYVQLEGRVRDGDEGRKEGVKLLLIANTMYCCTAV